MSVSECNLDHAEGLLALNTYSGSKRLSCQNGNCGKNDEAFHIYVSSYLILIVFASMLSYYGGVFYFWNHMCFACFSRRML